LTSPTPLQPKPENAPREQTRAFIPAHITDK